MSTIDSNCAEPPMVRFLPGFHPLNELWEGEKALFPSESSARWYLRLFRASLAQAEAVAMVRGRLVVHPERFAEVLRKAAMEAFATRGHRA